jgi:hypothetical protein
MRHTGFPKPCHSAMVQQTAPMVHPDGDLECIETIVLNRVVGDMVKLRRRTRACSKSA